VGGVDHEGSPGEGWISGVAVASVAVASWEESGRACGGAGGFEGSSLPALIEVVFRNGLGVGGIEPGGPGASLTTERVFRRLAGAQRRQPGGLIEVVGEGFVGDLVVIPTVGPQSSSAWGGPLAGWVSGGEVGSPIWTRIRVMGSGSVRNAMNVRGV
jgi:hypothetical protein